MAVVTDAMKSFLGEVFSVDTFKLFYGGDGTITRTNTLYG